VLEWFAEYRPGYENIDNEGRGRAPSFNAPQAAINDDRDGRAGKRAQTKETQWL